MTLRQGSGVTATCCASPFNTCRSSASSAWPSSVAWSLPFTLSTSKVKLVKIARRLQV